MGWGDIFLGARPNYQLLPGMDKSIGAIEGLDFGGLGYAGKSAKKTLKALDRGDDVSGMGQFAEIGQNEAKDLDEVRMNYMTGANALEGAAGGDQLNQINRMRDLAEERVREQGGRNRVAALGDLRRSATDAFTHARDTWNENELRRQQLLLQARGNVYNNQRSGGILNSLIQGGASVAAAFA